SGHCSCNSGVHAQDTIKARVFGFDITQSRANVDCGVVGPCNAVSSGCTYSPHSKLGGGGSAVSSILRTTGEEGSLTQPSKSTPRTHQHRQPSARPAFSFPWSNFSSRGGNAAASVGGTLTQSPSKSK